MAVIEFLENQANKIEGLAYAGFETFRGSPYTSCARETGQNSRDALDDASHAVRVTFNVREISRSQVPFADQLQHSIECCLTDSRDEKSRQHLERALETIKAPSIKILEIADYNTTGLTGPTDDPHSVFSALVKGDGVTQKSDPTAAGSYGIGKNAAYAVSDLQTVIYSTCWRVASSAASKFAAQGRLRLISHTDGAKNFSAEGYWGDPGFRAIENAAQVPTWVRRSHVGTTILSIGFRAQDHWSSRMALSLATNFFLAIHRKEIEFVVGETVLNHETLDTVLESTELRDAAEASDQIEVLERAKRLLDCVRSESTTKHSISIAGLGDFTFHLRIAEDLPREVHILRNGIYITNNLSKFGDQLKKFPGTREFIALLEPSRSERGKAPSRLLKQLENPMHTEFEPERIVDEAEQAVARRQIKELVKQVRKIIRAAASIEDLEESRLDELSHLFATGGRNQTSKGDDGETDPENVRYGEAQRGTRQKRSGKSDRVGEETAVGADPKNEGDRKHTGKSKRSGQSAGSRTVIPITDLRATLPAAGDGRSRNIHFTPGADGGIEVAVQAAGLSGDVPLRITSADIGKIANGRLFTRVSAGNRMSINVVFDEAFTGPIEVIAVRTANSEKENLK